MKKWPKAWLCAVDNTIHFKADRILEILDAVGALREPEEPLTRWVVIWSHRIDHAYLTKEEADYACAQSGSGVVKCFREVEDSE